MSYITFNAAGASSTWGATPSQRVNNASLAVWYAALKNPLAVGLQEVCDNLNPSISDAREYLETELVSRGYHWQAESTKDLPNIGCRQGTWIYATGTYVWSSSWHLPYDGDELRVAECIKSQGFVVMLNCTTHMSTEGPSHSLTQSTNYRDWVAAMSPGSFSVSAGGDYNAPWNTPAPNLWYSNYAEGDYIFHQNTLSSSKVDYIFGRTPLHSADGSPILTGRGTYSDHHLLWAPFHWNY